MSNPARATAIGDVVITSRPFADYTAQFALSTQDLLRGPILDCPGGASDFAATLRSLGGTAVSADPCYQDSPTLLADRIERDLAHVLQWTAAQPQRFPRNKAGQWSHAPRWTSAAETFLADFRRDRDQNTSHYQSARLPELPFPDGSFTLAVSGFLLFTYPQHFDYAFHLAAVRELTRVAADVRLHPLNDSAQTPYHALPRLLEHLAAEGITADVIPVPGQSDGRDHHCLRLTRHHVPEESS